MALNFRVGVESGLRASKCRVWLRGFRIQYIMRKS